MPSPVDLEHQEDVMPKPMPPVPPANRSPKGTGDAQEAPKDTAGPERPVENIDQQGERANVRQNTTTQDRNRP